MQKFLDNKTSIGNEYVRITFKKRDSIYGLFVKGHNDYKELKAKNFWRIVPQSQFDAYKQTKNLNLARIFNGFEFSKLTIYKESFE
ncbi:MAG: short-chain dehydrogenase [Chitinophagaceae bacterium]|nr:short-chain dehydrogenase [Chitinophagaceae bacterium]